VQEIVMSSSSARLSTPEGPVSVSGVPNLPARFTNTLTSRYIGTGELCLHAVIGSEGPLLLLVHLARDRVTASELHRWAE
jgi:hypothetical protein